MINDAENVSLITGIYIFLQYITIVNKVILNCNHISQYNCSYWIIDERNADLVSRREKKSYTDPKTFRVDGCAWNHTHS